MIIFELGCESGHRFEGWFGSAGDFDAQLGRGLLECPACGSHAVAKIPHAKIAVSESSASAPAAPQGVAAQPAPAASAHSAERFQAVAAFMQRVLAETEDVGRAFPEEARRIHYDEAPSRAIRGTASATETRELLEEGIAVLPLPLPSRDELN